MAAKGFVIVIHFILLSDFASGPSFKVGII